MNKTVDQCLILIALALMFVLFAVVNFEPEEIIYTGFSSRDFYVELPEPELIVEPEIELKEPEVFEVRREIRRRMGEIPLSCSRLVLGNSYRVFLTAYCAEECGWNYSTSSGEICHRSEWVNRYEPTTCAIDLNYFRYGDMFYVPSEDRVYIAEDTGAFRGMWLDLYQNDMSDVHGYNTRYETVYRVNIEYYTVSSSIYNVRDLILDNLSNI